MNYKNTCQHAGHHQTCQNNGQKLHRDKTNDALSSPPTGLVDTVKRFLGLL